MKHEPSKGASCFPALASTSTLLDTALLSLLHRHWSKYENGGSRHDCSCAVVICRAPKSGPAALAVSLVVRTALVASTVGIALSLPFFAYMAALIGGLFGLSVCVVVPALFYLQMSKG